MVADAVEVDIAKQAWTVDYAEAISDAQTMRVEDIDIIYAGLADREQVHLPGTGRD
jgi:hypothetical protein